MFCGLVTLCEERRPSSSCSSDSLLCEFMKAIEKTVETVSGGLRWQCQTDDLVLEEERMVWGTLETSRASLSDGDPFIKVVVMGQCLITHVMWQRQKQEHVTRMLNNLKPRGFHPPQLWTRARLRSVVIPHPLLRLHYFPKSSDNLYPAHTVPSDPRHWHGMKPET